MAAETAGHGGTGTVDGIVVVAHGSRRAASNETFVEFVAGLGLGSITEPAFLEAAAPTIADAVDKCVAAGAERVIALPYFLLPGNHWDRDIPAAMGEAADRHGVPWLVGAPVGIDPAMAAVVRATLDRCAAHASGTGPACVLCEGTEACRWHDG